jgi:acyl carrier protein
MENKIKDIIASVFAIDRKEVGDDASTDTIENWDSIRHMNLVVALEEEFGVEFDDDELIDMVNYKIIVATMKEKLTR